MFCTSCGQAVEEGKAFCTKCGAPMSRAQATSAQGAGWQPPQVPPAKKNRTGLIVGSVIAAIIVLGGAGVGLWLGLRGDDAGPTGTTAPGSSTGTLAGDGSGTTETIPGLDGSTDGSDGTVAGNATTEYLIAMENLVMEMDFENGRIPELAVMINDSRPDVPSEVHDEFTTMADTLSTATSAVEALAVPAGYEDANYWLLEAAQHMANRIQSTIDGIEAMWETDSPSAGNAYFNTGRAERDAYLDAIESYWEVVPEGVLGD